MPKTRKRYIVLALVVILCGACYEVVHQTQLLVAIAQRQIWQDSWQRGIALLELNAKLYWFDARSHGALARAYFFHGERRKSREQLQIAMEMRPNRLDDVILMKKLNLVPDDFSPPILYETEHFTLRPIIASDVDQDYAAVMSSVDHLKGVLGDDWPSADLTREEDMEVLALHEEQFRRRELFVYTVLTPNQARCIGCVYIGPSKLDNYDAQVTLWVTKETLAKGQDARLFEAVRDWLASSWPFEQVIFPGRDMPWADFYVLLEEQERSNRR